MCCILHLPQRSSTLLELEAEVDQLVQVRQHQVLVLALEPSQVLPIPCGQSHAKHFEPAENWMDSLRHTDLTLSSTAHPAVEPRTSPPCVPLRCLEPTPYLFQLLLVEL